MAMTTSLELFKNLAQYDYNNQYYDFHNDYNCETISYSQGILLIILKKMLDGVLLSLKFTDVKITKLAFSNVKEVGGLTIDTLYRGRAELNGELIEISEDGRGYFYLEFYEGQKMEFWAKSMDVEQE